MYKNNEILFLIRVNFKLVTFRNSDYLEKTLFINSVRIESDRVC